TRDGATRFTVRHRSGASTCKSEVMRAGVAIALVFDTRRTLRWLAWSGYRVRARPARVPPSPSGSPGFTPLERSSAMRYARPNSDGSKVRYASRYGNFIGGEFVKPVKGQYFENPSPVTGQPF